MKLPLIQKFVLVYATESGESKLTLRIVRQEFATECYYRRIDERTPDTKAQSVHNISEIICRRVSGQSSTRNAGLDCASDLIQIKLIHRYVGNLVLPTVP